MNSSVRLFPRIALAAVLLSFGISSCSESVVDTNDQEDVPAGGGLTIYDATSNAYSLPGPNLSAVSLGLHVEGDADFEATFVTSPAPVNGGLGPVFNNTSCVGCHPRDGRGTPSEEGEAFRSMLFRISVPGVGPNGGPNPVPGMGGQLQDRAVYGVQPEGRITVTYVEVPDHFADGTEFSLRRPVYAVASAYRAVPSDMLMSPRVAPPVFGLGLLEAVPESAIMARADENDANGDGISGRPNIVWNVESGRATLGRFGWKAGAPTVRQQVAGAYNEDMGITTGLFRMESCHDQPQSQGNPDTIDIDDHRLEATAHYVRTLAVPAQRNRSNAAVVAGARIFREANCSGCHVPVLTTGSVDLPELSGQKFAPYTDLLLHDMGEGLADNRPDYLADGREWRTAPLWGIGLTSVVNGHTNFLHDGRARDLLEAIMWHGGEAERSREYVRRLSRQDRESLLAFLFSL